MEKTNATPTNATPIKSTPERDYATLITLMDVLEKRLETIACDPAPSIKDKQEMNTLMATQVVLGEWLEFAEECVSRKINRIANNEANGEGK